MVRIGLIAMVLAWVGCLQAPPGPASDEDGGAGGTDAAGMDGGGSTDGAVPSFDAGPVAEYHCRAVDVGPSIDGSEDSIWQQAIQVSMTAATAGFSEQRDAGYQLTSTMAFACLHDADHIYFWFSAVDGDNAGEVVMDGPNFREDDGVVLFLDAAGDRSGTYGPDDHAFIFRATDAAVEDQGNPSYQPDAEGDLTAPSYKIETQLDKAALSGLASDGLLGFNVALIDDDSFGDELADMFALWAMPLDQVPANCEEELFIWCDTTAFTTLLLE